MLNIVCVLRSGGKVGYDANWVAKLQHGVKKHLRADHRFVCFSDCDVPCERIPLQPIDLGFWSKIQIFQPGIIGNKNPCLYIDLDTVVCGGLDDILDRVSKQQFVMWYEADKQVHSSALMYWHGDFGHLWNLYQCQGYHYWRARYSKGSLYGDQALISEHVAHELFTDLCPRDWFHIATHRDQDKNFENIKLLMFRKSSNKPHVMTQHPLVRAHWS
jgi:hypothetical protein